MIKTSVIRNGFMGVEQPLFDVDVSNILFKRKEKKAKEIIDEYYNITITQKVLHEIKKKE